MRMVQGVLCAAQGTGYALDDMTRHPS